MYQSIPSVTILWATPRGIFMKGQMPHPLGTKKVRNPDPWGRKIVLKSQLLLKTQEKNTKHETEIVKNSSEMLICLEILKQ